MLELILGPSSLECVDTLDSETQQQLLRFPELGLYDVSRHSRLCLADFTTVGAAGLEPTTSAV